MALEGVHVEPLVSHANQTIEEKRPRHCASHDLLLVRGAVEMGEVADLVPDRGLALGAIEVLSHDGGPLDRGWLS